MLDPLSDILEMVQARCALSGKLIAGGEWARRFVNHGTIKFCAAVRGTAWWRLDGGEAAPFQAGDIIVMNGTRSLVLSTQEHMVAAANPEPLVRDDDGTYRLGNGADFVMLSGKVMVDEQYRSLLLAGLPPALLVGGGAPGAEILQWLLHQLVVEMSPGHRAGQTVVIAELARLLFINALRAYLANAPACDQGWLKGLGDGRLATVMARIHAEPGRPWTLDSLAQLAGVSRTTLAVRFREVIGMPPLTYLTMWRMFIAERRLRAGVALGQIAADVGYRSESAFSHAFKRVMGVAPGHSRRYSSKARRDDAVGEDAMNGFATF
jgi:AraC-like DNA-binding protein